MARILNFRSVNVFALEKQVWDYSYHSHNFYELILIEAGSGAHRLNEITFNYKKGDIFLLTPSDKHEFIIEEKTRFIYIKYTEEFLQDLLVLRKNNEWKDALKLTLTGRPVIMESVVSDPVETLHFFQLANILLQEFGNKSYYSQEIIADLFSAIMTILARNVNRISGKEKWLSIDGEKIDKVLSYINVNFLNKERMKIQNLAKEFLMSENYISIFVKKHTGLSIQNHVIRFKIKAAEKLLKQGRYNINEISEKLGFNDASHFNKIFKKYNAVSPQVFRERDSGYK